MKWKRNKGEGECRGEGSQKRLADKQAAERMWKRPCVAKEKRRLQSSELWKCCIMQNQYRLDGCLGWRGSFFFFLLETKPLVFSEILMILSEFRGKIKRIARWWWSKMMLERPVRTEDGGKPVRWSRYWYIREECCYVSLKSYIRN